MRIIWIMSRPLLGTLGTPKQNHTGSWVDAAFDGLKDIEDVEIHAIYMAKTVKSRLSMSVGISCISCLKNSIVILKK